MHIVHMGEVFRPRAASPITLLAAEWDDHEIDMGSVTHRRVGGRDKTIRNVTNFHTKRDTPLSIKQNCLMKRTGLITHGSVVQSARYASKLQVTASQFVCSEKSG